MNTFKIEIKKSTNEESVSFFEIVFYVDNVNLIEIIKKIETPFANKEGHPDLAGSYLGLDKEYYKKDYFLGKNPEYGEYENKTAILDCPCGCEGCWPLCTKITETNDTIRWSNFEQEHRSGELGSNVWDYGDLAFEFDKKQYIEELNKNHL